MAHSRSITSFLDVDAVLRAARDAGGAQYLAKDARGEHTPGAGLYWLQRARQYIKLLRERDERLRGGTSPGHSPFDDVRLVRRCGCRGKCEAKDALNCAGHIIDITPGLDIRGTLLSLDGAPLATTEAPPPTLTIDPLLEAALAAKRDLGLVEDDE